MSLRDAGTGSDRKSRYAKRPSIAWAVGSLELLVWVTFFDRPRTLNVNPCLRGKDFVHKELHSQ